MVFLLWLATGATLGFTSNVSSVDEDGGSVSLRVELITGQLGRAVELALNTRDGTAQGTVIGTQ